MHGFGPPPAFKGFTSTMPKCEMCGAYKVCKSPKMKVEGNGKQGILIIGEMPTQTDDKRGRPFSGEVGKMVRDELSRNGLSLRQDCWLMNALSCKPKGYPTPNQIEACRPLVLGAIRRLKPRVIILLGTAAVKSLMPHIWRGDKVGEIEMWAGQTIPERSLQAWVCPIVPPSSVLRAKNELVAKVARLKMSQQFKACASLEGRPPIPERPETDEIEIIMDTDEAAKIIRQETKKGGLSAFDYETTMLKPDGEGAEIYTCSICFRGERTIAYPWAGKAIKATRNYLVSDLPKIASNMKFEERWSKAIVGVNVKNWEWDTMQAAHVISHIPGITSVKYQAFVRLGTPIWDTKVSRYLTDGAGATGRNSIHKAPLRELLIYNGVDSLVEWRVAIHQAAQLGVKLKGL